MLQAVLVEGKTVSEFVDAYNETCAELSRFRVDSMRQISDTEALVYYEIPEELETVAEDGDDCDYEIDLRDLEDGECETVKVSLVLPKSKGRRCCECENYRWGKGCPYKDGHVKLMDDNCRMFNVVINVEV